MRRVICDRLCDSSLHSTKLDVEKHLALQEEKLELEAKLMAV